MLKFTETLIPTLKEDPVEAQVVSHKLMVRAGLIRQLAAGIYTWLPMGLKVLRKVEHIVRQEMDRSGAQEVLMPAVQPAELWKESTRWEQYGKELLRIHDRHDRDFCFGPTHEEVITDLVRKNLQSYKQLPANFYQIQTKFRDEVRPRFGIMRGREFLMKDAYSFDLNVEGLDQSYERMFQAYKRIFQRCGLAFRPVEADTGSIGGASSHEFHVLADSGEDTIASCSACDYAANLEKATAAPAPAATAAEAAADMTRVETPTQKTIEEVASALNVSPAQCVKTLVWRDAESDAWFLLLLRGDHELNEVKATNIAGAMSFMPEPGDVASALGVQVGFLGPVGAENFPVDVRIIADHALKGAHNMVCGANEAGWHLRGVNWNRDLAAPEFADLRNVVEGDGCPRCEAGKLKLNRGIEVGHVFKLGTKYSEALNVSVLDENGRGVNPIMGCYGIGVSRIVAAAIEQNHDDNGIVWPINLAPAQVHVIILNPKEEAAALTAVDMARRLEHAGLEVLLDDRDERPGVKFKDADLLGLPVRLVVGGRSFKEDQVELKMRRAPEPIKLPKNDAVDYITAKVMEAQAIV
ncbi:proline--tRNA ligase [Magnetofaba australis]|uniref:Proline--tRNA ligase n=1 Tax=Magnetofaba australis IT-1 TaxID=1434232 RepID=A0A1Y2K557_9PROT|nr:proline--tRNA ligase [Magnetofaba australis]OSM04811.1 putative prolyl-tRNA synthetase [Magnetofaba australis IT-1]